MVAYPVSTAALPSGYRITGERLTKRCTSAVKLLLCAQKVGFFDKVYNRDRLQKNGDLLRLKGHRDFSPLTRLLNEK